MSLENIRDHLSKFVHPFRLNQVRAKLLESKMMNPLPAGDRSGIPQLSLETGVRLFSGLLDAKLDSRLSS